VLSEAFSYLGATEIRCCFYKRHGAYVCFTFGFVFHHHIKAEAIESARSNNTPPVVAHGVNGLVGLVGFLTTGKWEMLVFAGSCLDVVPFFIGKGDCEHDDCVWVLGWSMLRELCFCQEQAKASKKRVVYCKKA
jgi:hypothetical protein